MKNKKDFDSVEMMRTIRNKADKEISNMSKEELKKYFKMRSEAFLKNHVKETTERRHRI